MKQQSVRDLLKEAEHLMVKANKAEALSDITWLMCHVLQCSKTQLSMNQDDPLPSEQVMMFNGLFKRRLKGEPIQYIIGSTEFYGYKFLVHHHVLIPRFETEELVEKCLQLCHEHNITTFIDMCCGSGCIGLTLLKEKPNMYGYLVDLSDEAIAQSIENAKLLEVTQHLRIVKSDLFEAIEPIQVDMIISNPPYIEHEVIESLEDEVKRGEPMMALDGGVDGLDFYKRIIESAMDHLNPGGFLMFEIGYNQLNAILDLMVLAGYKQVRGYQDLSGLDRMVIGQKQVNNGGDTIE